MRQNIKSREYLGRGLAFPLRVDARGGIALASGERDIVQSMHIILGTRPGERVMRPEFGCRAQDRLFEPRNAATETLIQQDVIEALERWEPRIDVQSVSVLSGEEPDSALWVEIEYTIKTTHDRRSIVYPFFLVGEEAW